MLSGPLCVENSVIYVVPNMEYPLLTLLLDMQEHGGMKCLNTDQYGPVPSEKIFYCYRLGVSRRRTHRPTQIHAA